MPYSVASELDLHRLNMCPKWVSSPGSVNPIALRKGKIAYNLSFQSAIGLMNLPVKTHKTYYHYYVHNNTCTRKSSIEFISISFLFLAFFFFFFFFELWLFFFLNCGEYHLEKGCILMTVRNMQADILFQFKINKDLH